MVSDELPCKETARILGEAIGKPDLAWKVIADADMQSNLDWAGLPAHAAAGLVEMNVSMHQGTLRRITSVTNPRRWAR